MLNLSLLVELLYGFAVVLGLCKAVLERSVLERSLLERNSPVELFGLVVLRLVACVVRTAFELELVIRLLRAVVGSITSSLPITPRVSRGGGEGGVTLIGVKDPSSHSQVIPQPPSPQACPHGSETE